jgi:hypothetical protein
VADECDLPTFPSGWGPVLEVSAAGYCGLLLSDCRFERVAGRLFLTGLNHDSRQAGEGSPLPQAVAWDTVLGVISFRSLAEHREWRRAHQARYKAQTQNGEIPF